MWQETNWDNIRYLTIEQISHILICSDCLLEEIKGDETCHK